MSGRKRTFRELRQIILIGLLSGQQTTNEISVKTGINWRTVESHLTFLIGKGFAAEVIKLKYVRIFKLTPIGEEHARFLLQTNDKGFLSQQPQRKQRGEKVPRGEVVQL